MDAKDSLISQEPIPAGAEEFSKRVHGLLDGQPKDEATVSQALEGMDAMLDVIAARLYSMASMLVGEGEDSIRLVETAVERTDLSACGDPIETRRSSRSVLCTAAIDLIAARKPGSLAAPEGLQHASTCIDDDDLESAGISRAELESMLAGPNRASIKNWIESLPTETRVIFVLRAVAGFTADETASMLATHGGNGAEGWNADGVREIFRQGLCSLASQLIHATTAK
jgi:DNA-directed RNA polymerase specialized sigma24 family protein